MLKLLVYNFKKEILSRTKAKTKNNRTCNLCSVKNIKSREKKKKKTATKKNNNNPLVSITKT